MKLFKRWQYVTWACKSMRNEPECWYRSYATDFYYGPSGVRLYVTAWFPFLATIEPTPGRELYLGPISAIWILFAKRRIAPENPREMCDGSWRAHTREYWCYREKGE